MRALLSHGISLVFQQANGVLDTQGTNALLPVVLLAVRVARRAISKPLTSRYYTSCAVLPTASARATAYSRTGKYSIASFNYACCIHLTNIHHIIGGPDNITPKQRESPV